jgi:protein-disulfide isomerase
MMRTLLLLLPALVLLGQTAPVANFKVSGSPAANVEIDAYTDYECPTCGRLYREFMPKFTADYIATGKIKFVHRDIPLSQHPHAQLAARYANAAGELGFYDIVVNQIFKTQDTWFVYGKNTGDIDGEVAQVLPPGAMQKVRALVKSDPALDESVKKDMAMAMNVDHVEATPTMIVVSNGKRENIGNVVSLPYNVFQKYLDQKLAVK